MALRLAAACWASASLPAVCPIRLRGGSAGARRGPVELHVINEHMGNLELLYVAGDTERRYWVIDARGDFRINTREGDVWYLRTKTGTLAAEITVGSDVSGIDFANTRVGHMVVSARSAGGIRTLDASSVAASSGQTLTGTWGARSAPALSSAVASAEGGRRKFYRVEYTDGDSEDMTECILAISTVSSVHFL